MSNFIEEFYDVPYLKEGKGIIFFANEPFYKLSGFSGQELLSLPLSKVWTDLLRIDEEPDSINGQQQVFLFTKSLEVKCVSIQRHQLNSKERLYVFEEKSSFLFENNNHFLERLILDNLIGIGVYAVPSFKLIRANQRYLSYLPEPFNTKDSALGRNLKDIIKDFQGGYAEKVLNNVIENNESLSVKEKQGLISYDNYKYWDNTLTPIVENGKVTYLVSMLDDVTERVLSRDHILRHSKIIEHQNIELEAIIENISDGLVVIDENEKVIKTNNTIKKIINSKMETDMTLSLSDMFKLNNKRVKDTSENEISTKDLPTIRALRGEKLEKQRIVVADDSKEIHLDCNATPVYDKEGNFKFAIITSHNVTELVQKDIEIRNQKEQLDMILENMGEALYVYDKEGKIVVINKAGREALHKPLSRAGETLESIEYYDLNGNKLLFEDLPLFHALNGRAVEEMTVLIKSPLDIKYYSLKSSPIFDENNNLIYAVVTGRDITEIVTYEQTINQQQAMLLKSEKDKNEMLQEALKLKDEFLYLITHEFRTPMTVVTSALQAINLLYKDEVTLNIEKYLRIIKQNTNRQLRLVNNLLDITRINSGHLKVNLAVFDIVHLTQIIIKSVEVYAQQKGVSIFFITSITQKLMLLDEEKYERILLNLLANALKFTPKGKNIYVVVKSSKIKGPNMISISVKDEGIGIPKEKQKIIFEKFGQADTSLSRQAEGTGLGLHLVKLFANALHGEILVDSEEGKGCSFTLLLPVSIPESVPEKSTTLKINNQLPQMEERLVHSMAIEFSDIYF